MYKKLHSRSKRASHGTRKRQSKSRGGTRSKIVLTKRIYDSKKKPSPKNLKKGQYYIIHSQNPNMNMEAKFEKYLVNGKNAIFSRDVVREKIDEDTGEFYNETDIARYNIPVENIIYIEKISEPVSYYKVHNLPEDIQKEIDSYIHMDY